ncbi:Pleckstrin homology domain-containing protein [Syncephalis plumigaleata]|nr:Pleckstrin homology domain-containing protein [Syncephalis plumigaleata]
MERVNCEIERADMRIYLFQLNDVLSCNPKDLQVLALLDPERQLIHEGSLMRQANIGRSFVTLFLFDHYLLLVKQRKLKERDRYVVYRRPIPLRMLMTTVEDEPASTSTGLVPFFRSASGGNNTTRTSFLLNSRISV